MDAKSRANFINSVADGINVPCPKCGMSNKSDSEFCTSCGTKIAVSQDEKKESPAFAPLNENEAPAVEPAKENAAPIKTVKYEEPSNAFAQGLPEWSIEPPQVMVRRH